MFRHQQNASMNKDNDSEASSSGTLSGFYTYKNTFDKDHVWLDIPKNGMVMVMIRKRGRKIGSISLLDEMIDG